MNSIKVKLSFIANFIAIFALIALGIISFYFTQASLYEATLQNQTNLLKITQTTVEDFRSKNIAFIENLAKDITSLPLNAINSEEGLIQNTGHLLKSYRHGINALAVYIGQSNGENIVSDESSDKLKPMLSSMAKLMAMMQPQDLGIKMLKIKIQLLQVQLISMQQVNNMLSPILKLFTKMVNSLGFWGLIFY